MEKNMYQDTNDYEQQLTQSHEPMQIESWPGSVYFFGKS